MGYYRTHRTVHFRRPGVLAAVLVGLLFAASPASAVPDDVKRVIHTFDFEERRLGNPEELPMYWTKVQGAGMPHYVNGRLSTDVARGGQYSFRLELNGGSLAYRYAPNRLRVMAGAHYRIEACVRTTVMAHARARLSAQLADIDGHLLPATLRHSDLYAARTDADGWTTLAIEVSATDPKAAFLVPEVSLLQPALYAPQSLGDKQVNAQDIRGVAWFDDITVSQIPRVLLTTKRPANVFRRGEPVRLFVQIDDRSTDDLSANLTVVDADGRVVHQWNGSDELARAEQIGPGRKALYLDVPELPAGYYRAALTLRSRDWTLGVQTTAFVQLADASRAVRPDGRLGFIATSLPSSAWDDLPEVLPMLSAGRVKLALWTRTGTIESLDPGRFDTLLERLQSLGITPTACLLDLPSRGSDGVTEWKGDGVKKTAAGTSPLPHTPTSPLHHSITPSPHHAPTWPRLLDADPATWRPALAALIARHANHLDRWQIGEDGTEAFVQDPKMRQAYDVVYAEFARLVRKPDLAMPWPAWYELDGTAPAAVALSVPPELVLPHQVPLYLKDVAREAAGSGAGGTSPTSIAANSTVMNAAANAGATRPTDTARDVRVSVSLGWLDRSRYGRQEQLRDLAQRVIHTLAAGSTRIDLPLPMTVRQQGDALVREPTEELIPLRTIITTLSGAEYKGKVPIAEGIEAFLFDRNGQGILALWDMGAQAGVRDLTVNLGSEPTLLDLWGNVTPLQRIRGQDGRIQLTVGRLPVFLVDVDGQLMQTRSSVAFDRPLLESSFQPHTRKVRFTNAYRSAISGTVKLKPPAGWVINPPTLAFSLNPGETFEKEVSIELPYNTVAGTKTIEAQFELQAEGTSRFSVPMQLSLGLSDVGMTTMAIRDADSVMVQQTITNYGDKPISYTAFAVIPGQARQERLVLQLAPGATTIKRYKFSGVDLTGSGKARVGVREMEGTRILNDEVAVR